MSKRSFNTTDSDDGYPVLDLAAGTYTLSISASGDSTSAYGLRLVDLASQEVHQAADIEENRQFQQIHVVAVGDRYITRHIGRLAVPEVLGGGATLASGAEPSDRYQRQGEERQERQHAHRREDAVLSYEAPLWFDLAKLRQRP